jgi:hypothetical protein
MPHVLTHVSCSSQVRGVEGAPAAIGTAVVVNELTQVVLWLAVNSTSPQHLADPIQLLLRKVADMVSFCLTFLYDATSCNICCMMALGFAALDSRLLIAVGAVTGANTKTFVIAHTAMLVVPSGWLSCRSCGVVHDTPPACSTRSLAAISAGCDLYHNCTTAAIEASFRACIVCNCLLWAFSQQCGISTCGDTPPALHQHAVSAACHVTPVGCTL